MTRTTENSGTTRSGNKYLLERNYKVTNCKVDNKTVERVLQSQKELCPSLLQSNTESQQELNQEDSNKNVGIEAGNSDNLIVENTDPKVENTLLQESAQASDVEADGCLLSREKHKDILESEDFSYIDENTPSENDNEKTLLDSATTLKDSINSQMPEEVIESLNKNNQSSKDIDKYSGEVEANSTQVASRSDITDNKNTSPTDEVLVDDEDTVNKVAESDVPIFMTSITEEMNLEEYAQSEWKGTTYNAELMRLGYSQITEATGCSAMRKIRGDNYCGLRATCFQILSQNLKVLQSWKNIEDILEVPQKLKERPWITEWNFAGRLKVSRKKKLETMHACLKCFCQELQNARSIENTSERIQYFFKYFNSDTKDEVLLFEALKLLMLHSAVLLYDDYQDGKQVPEFTWLLFARDTSPNPEQLMLKHLNSVGDSGGLEQIEMFLLGYCLNLTIRVVRPSKVQEDFMTFYPDDHKDDWDMCNLIAEDDRHYNIIVM